MNRMAFNDFGDTFEVIDQTGEEPKSGMVAAITKVFFLFK